MSRDDEITAATVGERKDLNATVHLADYDPAWPTMFERIAGEIRAALGDVAVDVVHVGSTSVPGLAAKPVIDIVLVVPDTTDEAAYVAAMEARGFVLRIREPDWFEHRLFKGRAPEANIHVFSAGCSEIARMLRFRDWLRTHDGDRLLYERTKRDLAARVWKHIQFYADAKGEVVQAIMARADAGAP